MNKIIASAVLVFSAYAQEEGALAPPPVVEEDIIAPPAPVEEEVAPPMVEVIATSTDNIEGCVAEIPVQQLDMPNPCVKADPVPLPMMPVAAPCGCQQRCPVADTTLPVNDCCLRASPCGAREPRKCDTPPAKMQGSRAENPVCSHVRF